MFRIGTYRSRNQHQQQPPEFLAPEASQPANQPANSTTMSTSLKSTNPKQRARERERGSAHKARSGEARRAGKLASAKSATLPPFCCLHATAEFTSRKNDADWLGDLLLLWYSYFYYSVSFSSNWGGPQPFFLLAKRYRQNAKLFFKNRQIRKNSDFWRLSVARTEGGNNKNRQIHLCGFYCVAKYRQAWLKSFTLFLVYI